MQHVERSVPERFIFGPYFLVPFFLAVNVLLFQIGMASRHKGTIRAALAGPIGLVALTLVGNRSDELFRGFLTLFTGRLGGTPLYLTLLAAVGFYAFASLRRVRLATELLTCALAALVVVGPGTLDLRGLDAPRSWPLLTIAALQLGLAVLRRDSWRTLVGAGCLVGAAMVGLGGTELPVPRGPTFFHVALAVLLILGAKFDDSLGRVLRNLGAVLVLLACVVCLTGRFDRGGGVPSWVVQVYPFLMAAMIAGYGWLLGHRVSLWVAGLCFSCGLIAIGWRGYASLRQIIVGLDFIMFGLAMLVVAQAISLAKAGFLPLWVLEDDGKSSLEP